MKYARIFPSDHLVSQNTNALRSSGECLFFKRIKYYLKKRSYGHLSLGMEINSEPVQEDRASQFPISDYLLEGTTEFTVEFQCSKLVFRG